MKKYLPVLKKCSLFDRISDDDILKMLGCLGATVETYDKKYTVFTEGKPAKHIGIVLSGSVQIIRIDYFGNRSIVGIAGPSELFCEAFACAGTESLPVTVTADEPGEIMLIESSRILHTCNNACSFHQMLIFNLMKTMSRKNIELHQRLSITSKRSTREKLLSYLMLCAKREGKSSFNIPFDRQELADYLEVDRSGLSAEISKLRKEGIIESKKSSFTLLSDDI